MPTRTPIEVEITLARLYDNGMSIKSIAQSTHHSQRVVRRAISEHGTHRASTVKRNTTEIFKTLNKESAYWLGFIAADGHIRYHPDKYRYELIVEINRKDEKHLDKLKTYIEFGSKFYRKRDNCVIYSFSSKQLVQNLMLWINPNNKTELNNFGMMPDAYKIDFVRGYFDGDGGLNGPGFSITSCPATLLPVSDFISKAIGYPARYHTKKNNKADCACWNKDARIKFRNIFDGEPKLERKW